MGDVCSGACVGWGFGRFRGWENFQRSCKTTQHQGTPRLTFTSPTSIPVMLNARPAAKRKLYQAAEPSPGSGPSADEEIDIFCWIRGISVHTFCVSMKKSQTVDRVKGEILKEMEIRERVRKTRLTLWKVSVSFPNVTEARPQNSSRFNSPTTTTLARQRTIVRWMRLESAYTRLKGYVTYLLMNLWRITST